ncbi:MAG TPA: ATP-binding protein [Gammaproteobacteria bacterium]|nr:ATP-binding protein [Gammaproteobacteria bacterium]
MNRIRLVHTTAFRLAMRYAALCCLLSAAGLGVLYWTTTAELDAQIDAGLRAEGAVLVRLYALKGSAGLEETVAARSSLTSLAASDLGDTGPRQYLLTDPKGARLAGTLSAWPRAMPAGDDAWATLRLVLPFDQPGLDQDGPVVRVRVHALALPGGYRLLIGQSLNETDELRATLLAVTLGAVLLILLAGVFGGVLVGRGVVRRLEQVTRAADTIMAGDLSGRIHEEGGRDEYDALAEKLNAMLARIEELMQRTREVTENVAHDLRSPLTRLRGQLEALARRGGEGDRDALHKAMEETDRLVAVLNSMLSIAGIGARGRDAWETLDLGRLCGDVAELYGALAEDKRIRFSTRFDDGVQVSGNRQLLAQAVSNLLDNALKYTPAGGQVSLLVERGMAEARIVVADSGPGIPAEMRGRVLERFVRLDASRSEPGNGLGLSLVAAVAAHHGAALRLEDNHPGLRAVLVFATL